LQFVLRKVVAIYNKTPSQFLVEPFVPGKCAPFIDVIRMIVVFLGVELIVIFFQGLRGKFEEMFGTFRKNGMFGVIFVLKK